MPYAVLAHRGDTDAELVARALALRTNAPPVALVWADELLFGSRFTHRVGDDEIETHVVSARGQHLASSELLGVVCRLAHSLPPQFAGAPAADRDYAAMESHALLLSWLASLDCPLLNPPSPRGLSGPALGLLEWLQLGSTAGFRSRHLHLAAGSAAPGPGWQAVAADLAASSTIAFEPLGKAPGNDIPRLWLEPLEAPPEQLLVVGEQVFGDAGREDAAACLELSRRALCPLLGIHLAPSGDGRGRGIFCGAETMPGLGPHGAKAVAGLLSGER